ncbi:hypothetical protein ABPG75_011500 [Micractinium tetrahymenae]
MPPPRAFLAAAALLLATGALADTGRPKTGDFKDRDEAYNSAKELERLDSTSKNALFEDWKKSYGRSYNNGTAEGKARYAAFMASMDEMVRWNQQADVTSFKGLNRFSDLTFDDFKGKYLMGGGRGGFNMTRIKGAARARRNLLSAPGARKLLQGAVPDAWDWRAQGKVPPPRDQGSCGSCWAFAAVGALEIKAQIDGALASPDVSEQQVVSCTKYPTYSSSGCNGGYSDEALDYISRLFVTTEGAMPYTSGNTGATGSCTISATSKPPSGSIKVSPTPGYYSLAPDPNTIMSALANVGPVVTYFYVQSSFYSYTSGIYQASSCATDSINHAMVIVGYNKTAGIGSPNSYWIIRNSWGAWGDGNSGYIKVQMTNDNVGACAMYSGLYSLSPSAQSVSLASAPRPLPSTACPFAAAAISPRTIPSTLALASSALALASSAQPWVPTATL